MLHRRVERRETVTVMNIGYYGEFFSHDANQEGKCSCGYTHPINDDGTSNVGVALFNHPEQHGPSALYLRECKDMASGKSWVEADPLW